MEKFNIIVKHNYETEIEVYAKNKADAIRKVREIDMTTDIIPQSMYTEATTSYEVAEANEDYDDDFDESDCDDCPYYDGEECLYDELY